MLLLNFFRWIKGYVSFTISSDCPEKFVNLLRKENINLWNLKKVCGVFSGDIIASEYKLLRGIAKKSNSKVKLKAKKGLPFIAFKYRRRWGAVAGFSVFILIIYSFSLYVWSVKVTGNEAIPEQEVVKVMQELGVSPGTLKSRINSKIIKQMAMARLGSVAWMSLNINGSCVEVNLKEKVVAPEIFHAGEPCNIIAGEDGQIERLETYCGTPTVNIGDVVTKGQLLVSGVVECADAHNLFLSADCRVFAKTKKKLIEKVPLNALKASDTGKIIKKYRMKIFNFEIPIGVWRKTDETFRYEVTCENLKIFNTELPVKIYKEIWYEQRCDEITLTDEQARQEAEKNMACRESLELEGAQILEKNTNGREENGEYILEVDFICIEDIAIKEKISFE